MKSGIYLILNTNNGRFYIGRSINVDARCQAHIRVLKRREHPNYKLQRDWENGDRLIFSILEYVREEILAEREQFYLDKFRPFYNIATDVLAPMMGRHHSQESKRKSSQTQKGRPKSVEWRRKISEAFPKCPVRCSNGSNYRSQLDAAKALGIRQGHIAEVISGKRPTASGYKFWRKKGA